MIIITSFTITPELSFNLNSMHNEWTFDNYKNIWELKIRSSRTSFNQSFLNSIIVTCGTVILSVIISTLSGYALAILKFPFSELIFILLILPILISMINLLYSPLFLNSKKLPIAYLIGGFILINRKVYDDVGGHEAVKNSFVEDKSLGELLKTAGYKLKFIRSGNIVKTFSNIGFSDNINAMQRGISSSFIDPSNNLSVGICSSLLGIL